MMTCTSAQNALFAEWDGRLTRVIKLSGNPPPVSNGKGGFARADRSRLLLHADPEYLPAFVFINEVQAGVERRLGATALDPRFGYQAVLASPFRIEVSVWLCDIHPDLEALIDR